MNKFSLKLNYFKVRKYNLKLSLPPGMLIHKSINIKIVHKGVQYPNISQNYTSLNQGSQIVHKGVQYLGSRFKGLTFPTHQPEIQMFSHPVVW